MGEENYGNVADGGRYRRPDFTLFILPITDRIDPEQESRRRGLEEEKKIPFQLLNLRKGFQIHLASLALIIVTDGQAETDSPKLDTRHS